MVKVKKRASKRVGTAQREKIKRKINEHHRKSRKSAKKDVTWKSKLKKDPGIPNSYPFKEQLLNEIEKKREMEEMEKIRLKEEKKKKNKSKKNGDQDEEDEEEEDDDDDEEGEGLGLDLEENDFGLGNNETEMELDDTPSVVMYQESLEDLIKDQDVHTLVHVLDARDPIISLVPKLIQSADQNGKNLLVALTRSELLPLESLSNLITHLSIQFKISPDQFFPLILTPPTATNQKALKEHLAECGNFPGVKDLVERIKELTVTRLEGLKKKQDSEDDDEELEVGAVAVVGIENAGRTSVANSISSCLNNTSEEESSPLDDLLIFDTPSLLSPNKPLLQDSVDEEEEDEEAHSSQTKSTSEIESLRILMRNQGSLNKIKDPLPLVSQIISRLTNPTDLMLIYNTPAFGSFSSTHNSKEAKRDEVEKNLKEFLISLARNRGKMSGKGIPDWWGSSRILLKDWSDGMIGYYTTLNNGNVELDESFKNQSKELREKLNGNLDFQGKLLLRKDWRKSTEVGKKELRLRLINENEEKPMTSRNDEKVEIYFRKLRGDEILGGDDDDEDGEGWEESELLDGEDDDEEEEEDEIEDQVEIDQDDDEDDDEEETNASNLKSILKPSSKKTSKKSKDSIKPRKSVTLGGSTSSNDKPIKKAKVVEEVEIKKPISKKEKRKSSSESVQEPVTKKVKGEKKEKIVAAKSKTTSKGVASKKSEQVKTKTTPQVKGPAPGEKYDFAQFF